LPPGDYDGMICSTAAMWPARCYYYGQPFNIIIVIVITIIDAIRYHTQQGCHTAVMRPLWTLVFTARCYASVVLAMALCPSVCPSVRLSVTSRSSTKTAKLRITQPTPHDTPGTLVFWCKRSPQNSTGITPCGGAKCRWGGSKSATFNKLLAISRKQYKIDA